MPRDKPEDATLFVSLQRLSRDGKSWIAAETALAKAEFAADGRRLLLILALGGALVICVFSVILLVSVFLVAVLAPLVGGLANAALIAAVGFIALAGLLAGLIWYLLSRHFGVLTILKRWKTMMMPDSGSSP